VVTKKDIISSVCEKPNISIKTELSVKSLLDQLRVGGSETNMDDLDSFLSEGEMICATLT
jgi:hypothetical protein